MAAAAALLLSGAAVQPALASMPTELFQVRVAGAAYATTSVKCQLIAG